MTSYQPTLERYFGNVQVVSGPLSSATLSVTSAPLRRRQNPSFSMLPCACRRQVSLLVARVCNAGDLMVAVSNSRPAFLRLLPTACDTRIPVTTNDDGATRTTTAGSVEAARGEDVEGEHHEVSITRRLPFPHPADLAGPGCLACRVRGRGGTGALGAGPEPAARACGGLHRIRRVRAARPAPIPDPGHCRRALAVGLRGRSRHHRPDWQLGVVGGSTPT